MPSSCPADDARQQPARPRGNTIPASRELNGVILRLLAKDPARRYQSCRDLAEELGKIRDSRA